jgi:hypothetical protein
MGAEYAGFNDILRDVDGGDACPGVARAGDQPVFDIDAP